MPSLRAKAFHEGASSWVRRTACSAARTLSKFSMFLEASLVFAKLANDFEKIPIMRKKKLGSRKAAKG